MRKNTLNSASRLQSVPTARFERTVTNTGSATISAENITFDEVRVKITGEASGAFNVGNFWVDMSKFRLQLTVNGMGVEQHEVFPRGNILPTLMAIHEQSNQLGLVRGDLNRFGREVAPAPNAINVEHLTIKIMPIELTGNDTAHLKFDVLDGFWNHPDFDATKCSVKVELQPTLDVADTIVKFEQFRAPDNQNTWVDLGTNIVDVNWVNTSMVNYLRTNDKFGTIELEYTLGSITSTRVFTESDLLEQAADTDHIHPNDLLGCINLLPVTSDKIQRNPYSRIRVKIEDAGAYDPTNTFFTVTRATRSQELYEGAVKSVAQFNRSSVNQVYKPL